jgi:hypothetical protein
VRDPRVEITSTADFQLRRVPGLLDRVEEQLLSILRTAEEVRKLQAGQFVLDGWLRLHVAGHVIWYELELQQRVARVLAVEREPGSGPSPAKVA